MTFNFSLYGLLWSGVFHILEIGSKMVASFLVFIMEVMTAYVMGTLLFDGVHYLLHQMARGNNTGLNNLGRIHFIHHRFFSTKLKIETTLHQENLRWHCLLEYLFCSFGIGLCLFFFDFNVILIAVFIRSIILVIFWRQQGMDINHRDYQTKLPASKHFLWVGPEYHALHHIYPNNYYSSTVQLLDRILGTGCQLAGKRIALTGSNGALGSRIRFYLEQQKAIVTPIIYMKDYSDNDYSPLKNKLACTDILILCHGARFENALQANYHSFIDIIEIFKQIENRSLAPKEIWALGSESECHPCFGHPLNAYARSKRLFARKASHYFYDKAFVYRHIVPSAFSSSMGPGMMTANFTARYILFFIKRGFKYIPVTYTGIAYINYLYFISLKWLYKREE